MPEIDQIFLETTNKCCGCCSTCLNRVMKRERGVMPLEDFKKCIDEITEKRLCNMVHLYGFGEPYLTPSYLSNYCYYAIPRLNEAKIASTIITNGMVVTDIPKGVTNFIISFNAGKPKTYEKITGLDFTTTYYNIIRLHKEWQLSNRADNTEIHMLVFEDNKDEVDDFIKMFKNLGANLRIGYKFDNQRGLIKDKTLEEYRDNKRIQCHYIKDVMNITWNGDVSICPHDADNEVVHGNVFEESIIDIWESWDTRLADPISVKFNELCLNCNYNTTTEGKFKLVKG